MEDNFTPELIEKAKTAKSTEELIALAKENGIELTEDKAEEYFERLNRSGELSDEELDNVSGGGCHTKVNGSKYTVVSSGCKCFTGKYEFFCDIVNGTLILKDGAQNRPREWDFFAMDGCCGRCYHLGIKKGIGYCKLTKK